jgi:hypothetical protein
MKNNKNIQNIVTLWTYKYVRIDIEMDPQSQMEFGGQEKKIELQVYRTVKCHCLHNNPYKLVK